MAHWPHKGTRLVHYLSQVLILLVASSCVLRSRYEASEQERIVQRRRADSLAFAIEVVKASSASLDSVFWYHAQPNSYARMYPLIDSLFVSRYEARERAAVGMEWTPIPFHVNRSDLSQQKVQLLDAYEATLKAYPDLRIGLIGRADPRGAASYNLELAGRRVETVRSALIARGIEPWRIEPIPVGEHAPVSLLDSEDVYEGERSVKGVVLDRSAPIKLQSDPPGAAVWLFRTDRDYRPWWTPSTTKQRSPRFASKTAIPIQS